jgi:hypothetical protein
MTLNAMSLEMFFRDHNLHTVDPIVFLFFCVSLGLEKDSTRHRYLRDLNVNKAGKGEISSINPTICSQEEGTVV